MLGRSALNTATRVLSSSTSDSTLAMSASRSNGTGASGTAGAVGEAGAAGAAGGRPSRPLRPVNMSGSARATDDTIGRQKRQNVSMKRLMEV